MAMKTWEDGWVNLDVKAEKGNSWTELPWTQHSDTHVDWVDTHVDWVEVVHQFVIYKGFICVEEDDVS